MRILLQLRFLYATHLQTALHIGCHADRGLGFVGKIRHVAIYGGAFTTAQLESEAVEEQKATPRKNPNLNTNAAAKLLTYYPLDDPPTSGQARELARNGKPGVYQEG